jgi:ABC-2 type transport system permease protein
MSVAAENTAARVTPQLRQALATNRRPEPPGAVANALTFGWRAILKIKHMPEQLFDVLVTPIMFTVLFTYLFGGALAGSPEKYLQFLLPGILVQTVVFTTLYTGLTLNTDISKGVFDRFRSLPIWKPAPIVGAMVGDAARYTVSSLIVVAIGLVMGFRPETGLPGIVLGIALLVLFGFGVSWIFVVLALLVRTPSTVMTMGWLVLMPLTFASNIFVEPETMPGWLQAIIAVNPVAILVSAVREVMNGTVGFADLGRALLAPAILTAILAPVAMMLYGRRQ